MTTPTTSLQRTYRYLRLAIAGCAVLIAVSVTIARIQLGTVLPSISAYFYSPARVAFVGGLIAVSVGILALSGRGFERTVLDAAALFAPLVAIVPTRVTPGTVPGLDAACPAAAESCIPADVIAGVDNGLLTYLVVGVIVLLISVLLARAQGTLRASVPSLLIAFVVIVTVTASWLAAREFFLDWAHLIATGIFFGLIAVAALRSIRPFDGEQPRSRTVQLLFGTIGVAIALDVIALVAVAVFTDADAIGSLIFILEFVALGLFVVFWILQTGRRWDSSDPSFRARATGATRAAL